MTTIEVPSSSYEHVRRHWKQKLIDGYGRFWQRMEFAAEWLDTHPALLLILLFLTYAAVGLRRAYTLPLWHDELFTYNLARSPSVAQMLRNIQQVDLNPPILYLLNYLTLRLPGAHHSEQFSSLAARLPSLFAGLVASLGLFSLIRRKLGPLYATAAVGFLWNTTFLTYTTEDRPYALISGLVVLLALAWEKAIQPHRNPLWIGSIALLGLALVGSHFMGTFLIMAFLLAEAARAWIRGRIDIPLLICFLLPFGIPIIYSRLISSYGAITFPAAFQPTFESFGLIYFTLLDNCILIFAVSISLCLVVNLRKSSAGPEEQGTGTAQLYQPAMSMPEWVLLMGILFEPILAISYIMRKHGAFFPRYGLPCCLAVALLLTALFAWRFRQLKSVALIVVLTSVIGIWYPSAARILRGIPSHPANARASGPMPDNYRTVEPDLPFVVASGLTFVEMNHRESPELLQRTYYLTDTPSAIKYAHATLFEREADVNRVFQFQSHVEPLQAFEALHPKFLVFGSYDYPENWLLRKLKADGATLQYLGSFITTYYESKDLYEVTIHPGLQQPQNHP